LTNSNLTPHLFIASPTDQSFISIFKKKIIIIIILISFYKIKLLLFYDLKSLGNFSPPQKNSKFIEFKPPQKQIHFFPNSSFEKKVNIRKKYNNNNNNKLLLLLLFMCIFWRGIVAILIFTLNFHFCHDTIINVDT
jgi:hypothetical protein